jgi:hypothetical protein
MSRRKLGVPVGGGGQQLLIAEPPRLADRVDVEVVADVAAAVQGADLGAHRIVEAEYRADSQAHRLVLPPVHAEVHVELDAFCRDHVQASEVLRPASQLNLAAAAAQPGSDMIDRQAERTLVGVGGEQVNVLGGTIDHPMLTDRPRARQREPIHAVQRDPGHSPLRCRVPGVLAHAAADDRSSGNRDSHIDITRNGNSSSGHTAISTSRLSTCTRSSTVPSFRTAR